MLSSKLGHSFDPVLAKISQFIFKKHEANANIITVFGTLLGFVSSACIVFDHFLCAGLALLVSGFCDMLDGAVARSSRKVTAFGGFLDSVLDRYTDLLLIGGVLIYYLMRQSAVMVVVTFISAIGTAIIPYARARAESLSIECKSGLLERPERIVLLLIGLFIPYTLSSVIVILAVLTHITVIQRMVTVRRALKHF
ncbi:MAG TPA: CDP-alcohol phosphatidyltransferase family protein [Syntrophorhabdaceae bacterium]|nr:CDP-alcohol phosphatidyltransferase family protein [Syntrophorhabdaceae bacterium]